MYLEHQESADSNFSDLPHEQGVEESKKFSMHSVSSYASELSYAGYWSVPLAYIKTTLDKVVPPEGQQGMIDFVSQGGEYKVDVHEFASGHNPHASQPENIGKILVKAVEGLLARGA
ncbi:uncharacterized protein HMPREF1541_04533 [Cyphellophora europaea CBS 101466]|uniref:AB hydrolase-1 domain-containing protein n=1 Tax=Cyphellophora europaea (strain CBS 101466) TaxID=1220924 RepID=W2RUY9_CYPE1|nr:uncharacterized protein HMPREF1541_04533 [Cyphellophora europaea CBS 101466]ETN40257.1 hypothetical protein HMPREF1541_04533 [Cyphellophora europaea CBS 101466]